jgi:hypothetical protein
MALETGMLVLGVSLAHLQSDSTVMAATQHDGEQGQGEETCIYSLGAPRLPLPFTYGGFWRSSGLRGLARWQARPALWCGSSGS